MTGGTATAAKAVAAPLRLQHYLVMAGVAAAVVLACLRYAPAAAGYGFLAVAPTGESGADGAAARVAAVAVARAADGGEAAAAAAAAGARDPASSSVVIFNFGDSNSDTGGMAAVNGMNINLPEGRTFFRRPTGRLSDGRLVIDFICELLMSSSSHISSNALFPATPRIKLLPTNIPKFLAFHPCKVKILLASS
jgi:hypothetical protein